MKANLKTMKTNKSQSTNAPNCLAIMAILAEMARCLNENIGKVQLAPIDQTLTAFEPADQSAVLPPVKH